MIFKQTHPEIPWRDITGTRNIILHDYDNVNIEVIWDTVVSDLPKLKKDIEEILREKLR